MRNSQIIKKDIMGVAAKLNKNIYIFQKIFLHDIICIVSAIFWNTNVYLYMHTGIYVA